LRAISASTQLDALQHIYEASQDAEVE